MAGAGSACEHRRSMMQRLIWLVTIVACSGKGPPPAQHAAAPPPVDAAVVASSGLDQDLAQLVERSLGLYQAVGEALAASGEDCAVASARLGQLAGSYRDVVAANAKVLHDGRIEELRAALAPHGEAFDAAAQAVMKSPTLAKCAPDAGFTRAFDALVAPPP
jgi:hypothetical protein